MSERREQIRLRHMLDHVREAVALAEGRARAELGSDRLLELALARLLEIVGDPASRVPQEERALYPGIPWPQIVGLRNRLSTATMRSTKTSSGRSFCRIYHCSSRFWKRFLQDTMRSKMLKSGSDWFITTNPR
jgi:uncharacterized protein with HEPN domain